VRDRFLDKSLLGYTSLGYRWRSHPSIDADLTGRTAVVTGATSGLGKQTATELARLGATVQLVGRNRDKMEQVSAGITEAVGSTGKFWHDRRPRPTHRFARTRETTEEREALWSELCRYSGWSGTLESLAESE
jgi:hypothetical protein